MRKCVGCEEHGLPEGHEDFYICYGCAAKLLGALEAECDEDLRKLKAKFDLPPVCPIRCAASTRAGLTRDGDICQGCVFAGMFRETVRAN